MSDRRLRELERRWQATGAASDEVAWLRERTRHVPSVAVLADVESNLEALSAVLDHVDSLGVERVICLGDLVGIGPDPVACVDRILERAAVTVAGACDRQVTSPSPNWGSRRSEEALAWARSVLRPGLFSRGAARRRWEFLVGLPTFHAEGEWLFTHGSPRDAWDIVQPADWILSSRSEEIMGSFDQRVLFAGRSHQPALFGRGWCLLADELEWRSELARGPKRIVCPGAVGHSKDGDWRASYLLVSGELLRWFRLEYDVERTVAAMLENPALHEGLGQRLLTGR